MESYIRCRRLLIGSGVLPLVFLTGWANISPNVLPTADLGYFDNAAYLGPITGSISNFLILTLFTFAFGIVSGVHLNPAITLATFGIRLSIFPRTVLYISFQLLGATFGAYSSALGMAVKILK